MRRKITAYRREAHHNIESRNADYAKKKTQIIQLTLGSSLINWTTNSSIESTTIICSSIDKSWFKDQWTYLLYYIATAFSHCIELISRLVQLNSRYKTNYSLSLINFSFAAMTTENMELKCADFAETLNLNFFWLRDHCRCNQCYSETTHQRKFNILDISENVRPKKIVFQKKDVVITCE